MSEEQTAGEQVPVEALLAEIAAISSHIIPLAIERIRNKMLEAEIDKLKQDPYGAKD